MKKCIFLVFIFLIATTPLFSQNIELPYYSNSSEIIQHTGYVLKYNEQYEQAEWVAYQLTDIEVNGQYVRSDKFYN